MQFKSVALAASLLLSAVAAQATSASLGTLGPSTVNSGGFSLTPGLVNDTFAFSLSQASTVQSNVTTFIGNFSPAFYSIVGTGADHLVGTSDDTPITGFVFSNVSTSHFTNLSAGSYYFNVFALASQSPSAYAISASATAQPVPEPQSYALFGAGLGVVGFLVARRRDR